MVFSSRSDDAHWQRATSPSPSGPRPADQSLRPRGAGLPSTAGFAVGDRVTLDSWGLGRVTEVTEDWVVVDFRAAGLRRIPAGTKGFSLL